MTDEAQAIIDELAEAIREERKGTPELDGYLTLSPHDKDRILAAASKPEKKGPWPLVLPHDSFNELEPGRNLTVTVAPDQHSDSLHFRVRGDPCNTRFNEDFPDWGSDSIWIEPHNVKRLLLALLEDAGIDLARHCEALRRRENNSLWLEEDEDMLLADADAMQELLGDSE